MCTNPAKAVACILRPFRPLKLVIVRVYQAKRRSNWKNTLKKVKKKKKEWVARSVHKNDTNGKPISATHKKLQ